ncbi:winged helix-turn-helix domain-containing protein [Streptacidiphilus fuscans]|uniref:Winged helix-turn-helix domain-containing protein n=1 Tax=Streptacidiphilus fuscans TaxID=2789292 RepID=A0A931B3S9_9ACTN|nr:winged helix-turn-helix domain-containing protein [Streptacidiphilus fuscans]MBF9069778.1 winged helix-turn-helix domain-containing protein [Streptacidiphilus fuscans]
MTASVLTPVSSAATAASAGATAGPRLRSVRPDESVQAAHSAAAHAAPAVSVAPAAKPGVYRLPENVLSGLRLGEQETPLVGYLLLVPAGTAPVVTPTPLVPTAVAPSAVAPTAVTAVSEPASVPAVAPAPVRQPAARPTPGLLVDRELRTAHLDGEQLELTYLEFELLAHLTAHPHRVHTRDRLVEAVWGYYGHVGDGRTVDVHVARLRRKLGPDYRAQIVTVRRVGYKYVPSSR